jgi:hypothetical protein
MGPILKTIFDTLGVAPPAGAIDGIYLETPFEMSGEGHRLRLNVQGGRATVEMASASFAAIQGTVEATIASPAAANNQLLRARLTNLLNRSIIPHASYCYEHMGEITTTRTNDDHSNEIKATARRRHNEILEAAVAIGRDFGIKDLRSLGHPSAFVLNDEIRPEYRAQGEEARGWRKTFYKSSWSSTVTGWKSTRLGQLKTEASTSATFASAYNLLSATDKPKAFVVRDANGQFPVVPYLDLDTPGNVHIDHKSSVSDHFQTDGKRQVQTDRETWYEMQSNLQLLNERENLRKGGPRVTNWGVEMSFRGPGET